MSDNSPIWKNSMFDKKPPTPPNPVHYGLNINSARKDLTQSKEYFNVNMLSNEYSSDKPEEKIMLKMDTDYKNDSYYKLNNTQSENCNMTVDMNLSDLTSNLDKSMRNMKNGKITLMDKQLRTLHKEIKGILATSKSPTDVSKTDRLAVIFFIKNLKNLFF